MLLLGEDEIAEGLVSLKNMETGEQLKLSAAEAVGRIRDAVSERNAQPVIRD